MTVQRWIPVLALVAVLLALTRPLTRPLGAALFALCEGRRTPLHAVLGT